MTNDLKVFNYSGKNVRVVSEEGRIWFLASDVCKLLNLTNTTTVLKRLSPEYSTKVQVETAGGIQNVNAISKEAVMELVLGSRKGTRKEIKEWFSNTLFPQLGMEWTLTEDRGETLANSDAYSIFCHPDFGNVRLKIDNDEPWFVATDVCKALAILNTSQAMARIDTSDKRVFSDVYSATNTLSAWCVNEPGLYSLVFESDKPQAKIFKRWISHDVLPSIRKHGAYMTPETIEKTLCDPDFIIKLATALKEERQKVAVLTPKAEYCDAVLQSPSLIATSVIAKDYGMSAARFNRMLENFGIQYKRGGIWVLKADYQDKGYMKSETFKYEGSNETFWWNKWTEAGRQFLYELLKARDILPVSERHAL